jgi:hypothetical protein
MRGVFPIAGCLSAAVLLLSYATAYIEAPHTLGLVVRDSTNIVWMEVTRVNKEKGLIVYKKLEDLKGQHPTVEIKHNIGQRGFHPREWQAVMAWAEPGKKAVFFHNGGASETCIGTYWYQCYPEGEWWGMSHGEPFLLRTFYGKPEKLAEAVRQILQGKEVVVTCLADGNKEQLHQRKGKVQRLKASLKLLDYNPKRDFVGWGGEDGEDIEDFKTITLLAESSPGWRFLPASAVRDAGNAWKLPDFDHSGWRTGKAPIGYGEAEIDQRQGTTVAEQGQDFVFRRSLDVPTDLLKQSGVVIRVSVASDDSAEVYLNGELIDKDPEEDHEFAYWNREIEVPAAKWKPGRNVIAVLVRNRQGSSDLYLDMEITALVPLPKPVRSVAAQSPSRGSLKVIPSPEPPGPKTELVVDAANRSVVVPCKIAPRKLSHLEDTYPLEVIATYPSPAGQKAHETVVVFTGIRPSEVARALQEFGLKPGRPAKGESRAEGPEVEIFLEWDRSGRTRRVAIEEVLTDTRTGQPFPKVTWHFTGSNLRQPDPEKEEAVYGADASGTLITIFPVTDETVIQSSLTLQEESVMKLERVQRELPREGGSARLIIRAK